MGILVLVPVRQHIGGHTAYIPEIPGSKQCHPVPAGQWAWSRVRKQGRCARAGGWDPEAKAGSRDKKEKEGAGPQGVRKELFLCALSLDSG